MGARRGGCKRGHFPPPPGNSKIWGLPTRITLCVKILIFFLKVSEETELRAPYLVSEETDEWPPIVSKETDLKGPPYSMQSNLSKGAPT